MNHPINKMVPLAGGALLVGLAVVFVLNAGSRSGEVSPGEQGLSQGGGSDVRDNAPAGEHRSLPGKSSRDRARAPRMQNQRVEVTPQQVLATVSGTPIRLEQLTTVRQGDQKPVAMERSIFRSRLQRAIEAELVLQAARAAGIGLTEGQERRLERIASKHDADLEALKPSGVTWDTVTEEQIDLERRLKEAMLLRQNLVAAEAGVAPSTKREQQAAYEEALNTMMTRLEAEAEIEIEPIPASAS